MAKAVSHPRHIAWALTVVLALLYTTYSARLPLNYADSDDLTLASWSGGLAHPPGYVIYTKLVGLWMLLAPGLSPARAAHLFSALASAGVAGLLFRVIHHWLVRQEKKHAVAVSLIATIVYTSQTQVQIHATVAEVFPLALLTMLAWIRTLQRSKAHTVSVWSPIAAALSIALHPLTLVPISIIGGLHMQRLAPKQRLQYLVIAVSVSIVLLALPLRINPLITQYSWEVSHSVSGLVRLFLRLDYAQTGSQIETYAHTFNLHHSIWSLLAFIRIQLQELGLLGSMLLVVGLIMLTKQGTKYRMVNIILLTGPLIIFYLKLPQPSLEADETYFIGTALRLRQLYLFQAALTFPIALGLSTILRLARIRAPIWKWLVLITLAGATTTAVYRLHQLSPRDDNATSVLTSNIINSLPTNSTLVVDHDMVFAFAYTQLIDKERLDLHIVPARFPLIIHNSIPPIPYHDEQSLQDLEIARYIASLVQDDQRVFLYAPSESLLLQLGVEGDPYFAVPHGYVIEVKKDPRPGPTTYDYGISASITTETQPETWWSKGYSSHMSTLHTQLMYYLARAGYMEAAEQHRKLAASLAITPQQEAVILKAFSEAEKDYVQLGSYYQYVPYSAAIYRMKADEARDAGKDDEAKYWQSRVLMSDPSSASDAAQVTQDLQQKH